MAQATRGIRVEPCHKRVRAYLAGQLVVDTLHPVLVWEGPHYPVYYLPASDVLAELIPAGQTEHSPSPGEGEVLDVKVATATAPGAALRYPGSPLVELRDLVRLDWNSMSEWFEEDEPVYTHARDPYTRIDILASSRRVRVELDGVTVADSRQPRILFETGLPPRFYLPLTDLRMGLLRPSDRETHCPYRGWEHGLVSWRARRPPRSAPGTGHAGRRSPGRRSRLPASPAARCRRRAGRSPARSSHGPAARR